MSSGGLLTYVGSYAGVQITGDPPPHQSPFYCFAQGDTVYETVMPEVDEKELEKTVNPIVQEYFEHGDTKEVQVSVQCRYLQPVVKLVDQSCTGSTHSYPSPSGLSPPLPADVAEGAEPGRS